MVATIVVVASAFTVTNYGLVLDYFGIKYSRLLPPSTAAADIEYYIFTPLHQILVNNDFARINATSPYGEDLRTIYSLPILDFFLIFKPNYWAYFILPPGNAFAFNNWFLIVAFFVGYTQLFQKFGTSTLVSVLVAAALFFSSFLQYWLPNFLPIMAFWPWMILAATHRNLIVAGIGTFYAGVVWLTSHIYPPILVPLAIAGAAIVLVLAPRKAIAIRVAILIPAAAAAAGLVYWYLHDAIAALQATSYPGNRSMQGGEATDFAMWWSQFIPTHFIHELKPLIPIEAPEAAGAGSILFLMLPFFLDWRHLLAPENAKLRIHAAILFAPLLLMWVWVLVPLPSWAGFPLLFNLVSPRRMVFAAGALMAALSILLVARGQLRITLVRVALVALVALISWLSLPIFSKQAAPLSLASLLDLAPVLIAPAVYLVHRFANKLTISAMAAGALLVNVTAFGGFWGIQSAAPIFNRPANELTRSLDAIANAHPDKLLVVPGERFNGALMNGWGYRSAAHAFLVPHPDYLRQYFPDTPEENFRYAFNRMSLLRVVTSDNLSAPGIGVMVPARSLQIPRIRTAVLGAPAQTSQGKSGAFQVNISDSILAVEGWARFEGISREQQLFLDLSFAVESVDLIHAASPIEGNQALGGFQAKIHLRAGVDPNSLKGQAIRVFSRDPALGLHELEGPATIP
jgi:hypothetical protein